MTTPASYSEYARVRYAIAGVGTTPALVTSAPSPAAPYANSSPIQTADSRVSLPSSICGRFASAGAPRLCDIARTSAAPRRRTVGRSSGYDPATPRTPSVPNSLGMVGLFGTGNPNLNGRRLDTRDTGVACGVRVHGQLILPDTETRQIDVRRHIVGFDARRQVAAAADRHVHFGGHGLGRQRW